MTHTSVQFNIHYDDSKVVAENNQQINHYCMKKCVETGGTSDQIKFYDTCGGWRDDNSGKKSSFELERCFKLLDNSFLPTTMDIRRVDFILHTIPNAQRPEDKYNEKSIQVYLEMDDEGPYVIKTWLDKLVVEYDVLDADMVYDCSTPDVGGYYNPQTERCWQDEVEFDWDMEVDDDELIKIYDRVKDIEQEDDRNSEFYNRIEEYFIAKLEENLIDYYRPQDHNEFFISRHQINSEIDRFYDAIQPYMVSLEEKMKKLEELEILLEQGEIDEGKYLEECNKLK